MYEDDINDLIQIADGEEIKRQFLQSRGKPVLLLSEDMVKRLAYVVAQRGIDVVDFEHYSSPCGCVGVRDEEGRITGMCHCAIGLAISAYKWDIAVALATNPTLSLPTAISTEHPMVPGVPFSVVEIEGTGEGSTATRVAMFLRKASATLKLPEAMNLARNGGVLWEAKELDTMDRNPFGLYSRETIFRFLEEGKRIGATFKTR